VLSFYNRVHPIDSSAPAQAVALGFCQGATLSVQSPTVAPPEWTWSWQIDQAAPLDAGAEQRVMADVLGDGVHHVVLQLHDGTAKVRTDPSGLLLQQVSWDVTVDAGGQVCALGPCDMNVSCDGDGGCVHVPKLEGAGCGAPRCAQGMSMAAPRCQ